VTSVSNPKLAVFYVFPQFVPAGTAVLPAAVLTASACGWRSSGADARRSKRPRGYEHAFAL
jgi:threonine/homoserine/homoserine lactone efflux protein